MDTRSLMITIVKTLPLLIFGFLFLDAVSKNPYSKKAKIMKAGAIAFLICYTVFFGIDTIQEKNKEFFCKRRK